MTAANPSVDLSWTQKSFDVLVIGGGNAALCAALTARRAGVTVLLLESAAESSRGGNSRYTRNLRYLHDEASDYLTGPYPEEEFWDDLLRVTGGETNRELARFTIRESSGVAGFMHQQGCRFQPPLRGTLQLSRTNAFFLGGGKALVNAYYQTARDLGVEIAYDSQVADLNIEGGEFHSARVVKADKTYQILAKAVVVASGGFQANIAWLKEYWGEAADNFIIRGTSQNQGRMLRVLLDRGVKPVGQPKQCHAVAVDARAPKFEGGIVTRLDCIPFGIVVNKKAERFYDEGEEFWPKRYAIWGILVAEQSDQMAFCIVDANAMGQFMPSVYPSIEAGSIRELAVRLELEPVALEETVDRFNRSVRKGTFDPNSLDDCGTENLDPPKSHWALPLDSPPFHGYPLRPGITFTYLGVTVNDRAQVIMQTGQPAPNIYAAGEIMAGNILGKGYLAGFGMTIGTVFGRIAGREAADYAKG